MLVRKAGGERKDPGEAPIYQEHGPYRSIPRRLWSPRRRGDWHRQRKNQIQWQRAWRLFDAACTSVRSLADHVHAQVPIPREDAEALAQELRSVRHTLDEDALSCFGPSAGEALSALFKLADQAFGAVGPPADNLTSTIDALLRALEAQRRALADWDPARTQVRIPAAGPVLPAAPGAPLFYSFPPADEDGLRNFLVPALPPEGSIVDHKLTSDEKNYKSSVFRISGIALIAAAFLAGAGTLFLGEYTLRLREDLEKIATKGKNGIDPLKGIGARLDEVSHQLDKTEAREALLADAVTRAGTQANLAASHAQATKQAAELAAEARAKAVSDVASINDGTEEQERALGHIGVRVDNLNKQIEGFETTLSSGLPVTLDATALTQAMDPLTVRLAKLEDRLDHPLPTAALPDLGSLTARLAMLEDRLDHSPPAAALPDLGSLTARVAMLEDRLDHPLPAASPPKLGRLTARVAKLEDRLDHPLPAATALKLGPVTARLAELGDRPDQPTPAASALSFPETEAGLTLEQRKQIQRALHLPSHLAHGTFGPNTRRAITAFRSSKNATTTGDLTADEINELLSPPP